MSYFHLANLSNDPEQEYFADAITEDLTTDLSRISDSFVIARNTAFTYKGKAVDVKQVSRELGVRYVLEGSVRRMGDQVQVNIQLIDGDTGRIHGPTGSTPTVRNLADAQNAITGRLARDSSLSIGAGCKPPIEQERAVDPNSRDLVMRGWACGTGPTPTVANREEALRVLRARTRNRSALG